MDRNQEILLQAANLLANNFDLAQSNQRTEADFLQELTKAIALMLTTATERLFVILYQLDVSERKVLDACASATTIAEQAAIIAQLVWQREKEKVKTRLEYKEKPQRIEEDDAEAW